MNVSATIVVPLLRQRDAWLEQAIESALTQTIPVEVLVITSPLTPAANLATLEAAGERAGARLRVAPRTGAGFANAINTGFGLARTPRVGLLLSDDWLEPTAMEACLSIEADIVSTGALRHDAAGRPLPHLRRSLDPAAYQAKATLEERASYLTHFLCFRRDVVLRAGGLDESIGDAPGIDDYDLLWTLLERGASVGLTADPQYHHRCHDGERLTMRSREEQVRTLELIFDKHGFAGPARDRLLREHARWFGRPEPVVHAELQAETAGYARAASSAASSGAADASESPNS